MAKSSDLRYEDFDPVSDLISEEGCDTLVIYLPGFKKEQLRVQLTTSRILRVSGERPIGDNKWRRFSKEFRVPPTVDTKEITAKFENGILHIRQPKLITSAPVGEKDKAKTPAEEPLKPQAPRQEAPPLEEEPQSKGKTDGYATPPSEFPGAGESEAKAEAKQDEKKEDTARKADDEIRDKSEETKSVIETLEKTKRVVYGSGLFREFGKPEKRKKLVVFTLLLILLTVLGFHIAKMFRSYSGDEQESFLDYNLQDLLRPT